ncbi:MAG TPA: hypothetical protein VE177_07640, partial [Candidatus Binatus sp.]|nr:hypothetical protein [Candidatus Binatus sp.]
MIRLFHWNQSEVANLIFKIKANGFEVDHSTFKSSQIKELARRPPQAVVIDLSRLPSQGRDLAANLLQYKSLQNTPFVFIDGDEEKLPRVKRIFPHAVYARSE